MSAVGHVTCEQCGANVESRPGAEVTLVCPSCGHQQAIAPAAPAAKDDVAALIEASLAASPAAEEATLTCGRCGARTTVPATVLAERCPFCGTPTVSPSRDRLRRPSAVLPFRLDEAAARAAVVAWERGLWFRPTRLGPADGGWALTAVYLPYWSFDWDVTTDYEGACGHTSDNQTSWRDVRGTVRTRLDGSTVLGSRGIDREQGAELEPWDAEAAVGFDDAYLQGVRAELSALSVAEATDLGARLLERAVVYDVERAIGGDHQRIDAKTIRYQAAAVRLVLMPIWVTHYQHEGRRHQVLVNARTGEVIGDRPVSRPKLAAAGLAPFAVAAAGAVWLPSTLGWRSAHTLRGHALGFWTVLGAIGLLGLVLGSALAARARRAGPARQRDLHVARRGPGTSGLQVDPVSMWRGALQADGPGRATLVQISGFALLFIALMPAAVLAMFPETMPIVMMHAFSALAIVAFGWAIGRAGRDRRKLLGLDERARE
jgi:predicted RNA-binding Zn-ribbon protein involved in translation (DUF1610 family)